MRFYLLLVLTLAVFLQLVAAKVAPIEPAQHHHTTTVASLRGDADSLRVARGAPSGQPPHGGPPPPRTTAASSSG